MNNSYSVDFKEAIFELLTKPEFRKELMENADMALGKYASLTDDEKAKLKQLAQEEQESVSKIGMKLEKREDAGWAHI